MKTKLLMMLAGIVLLGACKNRGSQYEMLNNNSSADSVSTQKEIVAAPKLVKTAEMHFKVKNVAKTSEDITILATQYKGMVMHHQMNSTVERSNDVQLNNDSVMRVTSLNTSADITVNVPAEKLEAFMNQVAHMGLYVSMRKMDIEDNTLDYLSNQLKLNSRQQLISQQKSGKVIIKNPANVMLLKDDMVDQQIENRRINNAVKYSAVSLNLYQSNTISKEIIVNDDPASYHLPFFSAFSQALVNGWFIFKELLLGLANLWTVILTGIVVWLLIRRYRKEKIVIKAATA